MTALKKGVPVSEIRFDTEFPFCISDKNLRGLQTSGLFSVNELRAINSENALRLLPAIKS